MGSSLLVRNGTVVTMVDPEQVGTADVLVEDGIITGIGVGLDAAGVDEVIDVDGGIVLPGLIDTHRHLWYTPVRATAMDHGFADLLSGLWPTVGANITPDDLYAATRAGIVDALDHGVTTVLDYCHAINTPGHAERAIEAHESLPGRAVFGYGPTLAAKSEDIALATSDWSHAVETAARLQGHHRARLTMSLAIQNPALSNPRRFRGDVETARELGIPITTHIAPQAGGAPAHEVTMMSEWGLLGPDMHLSHCCGTTTPEFEQIRDAGATVTVSPMAEWWLGFGFPLVHQMQKAGLQPAVGVDAVCSASGDLFEEARVGLLASRAGATAELAAQGRPLLTGAELGMSTFDALATITSRGAAACSLTDRIGTLEVGKAADIIVVAPTEPALEAAEVIPWVVATAHGSDVDTVIVDGAVVKRSGSLVGIDLEEIAAGHAAARLSMLGRA